MSCKTVLPKAEDAEHVTQTRKNGSDAMTSMLGYPCRDCLALLGEMRLAVNEAAAITEQAGVLIHATKASEHIDEMEQIRARWEVAQQRWVLAAADLKNHPAITPRHARLSDTLQNRALESMNCKTCDDLLGAYQHAVHLYTTTMVNTAGLFGANRRLASQEAERLKLACRDADNALISHLHQDHGNAAG